MPQIPIYKKIIKKKR